MCMRGYVKSMSVFCMVTLILQVWLREYLCDAGFSKSLVSYVLLQKCEGKISQRLNIKRKSL